MENKKVMDLTLPRYVVAFLAIQLLLRAAFADGTANQPIFITEPCKNAGLSAPFDIASIKVSIASADIRELNYLLHCLGQIKSAESEEALLSMTQDNFEAIVRRLATANLGVSSLKRLKDLLGDKNTAISEQAAYRLLSLADFHSTPVAEILVSALDNSETRNMSLRVSSGVLASLLKRRPEFQSEYEKTLISQLAARIKKIYSEYSDKDTKFIEHLSSMTSYSEYFYDNVEPLFKTVDLEQFFRLVSQLELAVFFEEYSITLKNSNLEGIAFDEFISNLRGKRIFRKSVIPRLSELLHSKDPEIKKMALRALISVARTLKTERKDLVLSEVQLGLSSVDPDIRGTISYIIRELSDSEIDFIEFVPSLISIYSHDMHRNSASLAGSAIQCLGLDALHAVVAHRKSIDKCTFIRLVSNFYQPEPDGKRSHCRVVTEYAVSEALKEQR